MLVTHVIPTPVLHLGGGGGERRGAFVPPPLEQNPKCSPELHITTNIPLAASEIIGIIEVLPSLSH